MKIQVEKGNVLYDYHDRRFGADGARTFSWLPGGHSLRMLVLCHVFLIDCLTYTHSAVTPGAYVLNFLLYEKASEGVEGIRIGAACHQTADLLMTGKFAML